MVTPLDDLSVFQHHNRVGVAHRRKPVGDGQRCPQHQLIHTVLNLLFRSRINRAGRLIQNQHRRSATAARAIDNNCR